MKSISLQTLIQFAGGTIRQGEPTRLVTTVSTDTRKLAEGDVFVALAGDRFDAHDFVPQAAAAGVAAVVVNRFDPAWSSLPCAIVEVPETLKALQDMARGYRTWHQPLVVGLTGSNGKTSTKDLVATVLARRFQTSATLGNLNNHIGLPLTLLRLNEGDSCAVVEMGMNHPGEIKTLVDIAKPDAAIVTNVGIAHIENMGSRDAIGWEKATLPTQVHPGGVVVLNANDDYTPLIARHCQARVLTAGAHKGDVRAINLRADGKGTTFDLDFGGEVVETFLPVIGDHMVGNAALAAGMGFAQGISPAEIADALRNARLTGGRMETKTVQGVLFIDDSYNANPDSMKAGLSTLASSKVTGRKVAVLGHMGELGTYAERGHREIGEWAAEMGLDALCTVGEKANGISEAARSSGLVDSQAFATHEACAAHLRQFLRAGDAVLLKGSRSAGMEKVLTHFQAS